MTAYNYTFQTPHHSYDLIPDPLDPNMVRVKSEFKDSIEDFLNTIELSGRANDEDFAALKLNIKEGQNSYDTYWYTEVSKEDLALYFEFEVRFFMGAVPEA
jgi:hypothetical protein